MPSLQVPTRMNELDAINLMLRNIGEDPVSSLGPNSKPTAQKAQSMLAEENISVQSEGYNFCTDQALTLSPNLDGEIALPSNILSFYPVGRSEHMVVHEGEGGRLYDASKSTFKFTESIQLKAVLARPFAAIPQPARWYIATSASLRFANSENPGGASLRVTAEDVSNAKASLERFDRRLRKGGLRVHNPHFKRMRGSR